LIDENGKPIIKSSKLIGWPNNGAECYHILSDGKVMVETFDELDFTNYKYNSTFPAKDFDPTYDSFLDKFEISMIFNTV